MPTLLSQIFTTVLLLLFGVVALIIARRISVQAGLPRASWYLSGAVLASMAATKVPQDIAAVWAFLSGPGSAVYADYLRWSPVANHGRTFFAIAFHAALLVLSLGRTVPRRHMWLLITAGLVSSFAIGGAIGLREGSILSRVHYSETAIFDTVAFFLLLAALLVALVRNAMDWVLWSSILLYGLVLGLGVLWHAALAWIRVPGAWAPSPLSLHVYRNLMIAGMVGLALYRLHTIRKGISVTGLLDKSPEARGFVLR